MSKAPHFELSQSCVVEKYNELNGIVDSVYYSSKTNPLLTPILEEKTDAFFSVHTKDELKHVSDKGRVLFFGVAWTNDDINSLYESGVRQFAVDSRTDLERFLEIIGEREATLFLRMKLKENSVRSEKYYVFGLGKQFVSDSLKKIHIAKPNLKLGVHVHRKTQNLNEWDLQTDVCHALDDDAFKCLTYLNFGGGLPSLYSNTNDKVIPSILKKIASFRVWLNEQGIKLIAEPGRFIAAPSVKLITHVTCIEAQTLFLDVSVYNANTDAIFGGQRLLVENEKKTGEYYMFKGKTPDSIDILRYRVYLEKTPVVGDTITFLNAGAYNFHCDFCELERIKTVIIK